MAAKSLINTIESEQLNTRSELHYLYFYSYQ